MYLHICAWASIFILAFIQTQNMIKDIVGATTLFSVASAVRTQVRRQRVGMHRDTDDDLSIDSSDPARAAGAASHPEHHQPRQGNAITTTRPLDLAHSHMQFAKRRESELPQITRKHKKDDEEVIAYKSKQRKH